MELNHFEKMESYIPMDLLNLKPLISAVGIMSFFIVLRYFALVWPIYWYFWRKKPTSSKFQRLHDQKIKPNQVRYEITWSLISTLIFALSGYLIGILWQMGYSQIYLKFDEWGLWYLPLSFLILTLVHEFYFYATHVLMHQPKFFLKIHSVHHYSKKTSPWASFSFHPWEALIQAMFLPLAICIVPVHPVVLIIYLVFMTLTAISNHLGLELISSPCIKKWFISGSHHAIHHEKYNYNYGLYYRFLDILLKTEYYKPRLHHAESRRKI